MNKINEVKKMQTEFGAMIKYKRKEKRITQEKLAELVGITDVYLRDLERGEYTATWIIFMKLCSILEVDLNEFQTRFILPMVEEAKKTANVERRYKLKT